ncbi:MAG: MFS transporter, partial [Sporomusaceae bacterium]|nr:MFS transporter [Sporomusaceae bacterium]
MQHSLLTPQFMKLTAAQFFYWVCLNIFMPVIPLHYHSMGMNDFKIGFIVGTISIFGMMCRVMAGKSVNRFGAVPVIALGLALSLFGASGHFFAQSWEAALVSAAFQGVGLACYASAALALTSFMFEEKYIVDVFAIFTMAGIFGSSLGLGLATWIYGLGGIQYIVGISLTAVTVSIILFPKHPVTVVKPKKSDAPALKSIAVNPKIYIPTFSIFITNLSFSGTMTFLPLFMLSRGITDFNIFFVSYGVSVIFFRIMIVRFCHTFELRNIETVSVAAAGSAMLAIALAETWLLLILG